MREKEFNKIKSKIDSFKFTSMEYMDYEDVSGYEIEVENENIIMIYGYNREAKINEYHWATSKV